MITIRANKWVEINSAASQWSGAGVTESVHGKERTVSCRKHQTIILPLLMKVTPASSDRPLTSLCGKLADILGQFSLVNMFTPPVLNL